MRLKTFSAATIKEAMAEVRRVLGPDAMIVSTQQARGGGMVKVVAAVEGNARPAPAPIQNTPARGMPVQQPAETPAGLRSALPQREAGPLTPAAPAGAAVSIAAILERHGVLKPLADMLARMADQVEAASDELALAGALDAACRFLPIASAPARPLLLAGAPGVGKTSSIARLAARAALEGRQVKLFTTDVERTGGVEQLAGYAALLNLHVVVAQGADDLARKLAALPPQNDGLVLVDTAGINPFAAPELNGVMQLAKAIDAEIVAVVAAGGDASEAAEIAQIYARIGAQRFIATRLDATRRFGSLLSLANVFGLKGGGARASQVTGGGLAFACVSATPFIGEGLQSINPVSLARLLMSSPAAGAAPVFLASRSY